MNDKKIREFVKQLKSKKIANIVNLVGYIDNINYLKSNLENTIFSLKVNTLIPNFIIKELLPYMIKIQFGRIVNGSSIGVKFGGEKVRIITVYQSTLEFIPSYIKSYL